MNSFMQWATTISAVVIAASAAIAVIELRKVRFLLEELLLRSTTTGPPPDPCLGQAIFISKGGKWVLAEDLSGPGHRAVPPTMEPSFEGQVIRRTSVPKESS